MTKLRFKPGPRALIQASIEPSLPPVGRQAVNFTRAMVTEGISRMRGNPGYVSTEIASRRFATCQTCEYYRSSDERCSHVKCGCYLRGALLEKTKLFGQRCPDGKW